MTIVDLDELNPGARFDFETDKNGKTLSWVKVRAISNDQMMKIRQECVIKQDDLFKKLKNGQYQRIPVEDKYDNAKISTMLWDYAIVNWGGFSDKNGKEVPCTQENKIKFMGEWPAFNSFIDKCSEIVNSAYLDDVKESEKN